MATDSKSEDRRIQRTRQLLRQASIELMQEKGFQALNIRDIAERANVSRGTFYLYYADKYALLESLLHELFQELIGPLPPVDHWNQSTLRRFTQIVLEHFRNVQRRCHPLGIIDPLIERFFQEEVAGLLLQWLNHQRRSEIRGGPPRKTIAHTMSWAIIGAALQWSQEPTIMSSEQMAHDLMQTLMEGVERLALDAPSD